jgi:hypothetical protein
LSKRNPEILFVLLAVFAVAALVFLTWANYRYSLANPGGIDFLPHWLGTRLMLMEGQSPYSEETARVVQSAMSELPRGDEKGAQYFLSPFYSIFVFAPFALIEDYNTARAVWMTTLEVAAVLIVAAGLGLSRWRVKPAMLAMVLIFAALWFYTIQAVLNGDAGLLVGLLIAAALLSIRSEQDGLAGFLLALATVKLEMVILLAIFVIVWSISNQRWIIVWSFLGSVALMTAVTAMLVPNWIWQNLQQFAGFNRLEVVDTAGEIFAVWMPGVGSQLGWGVMVVATATLLWEWRAAWGKEYRWFLWAALLTLGFSFWVGIPTATENYMVMFPALMVIFAAWDDEWGVLGRALIYLSVLLLFFGIWWVYLAGVNGSPLGRTEPPVILFFLLPIFLVIGLYWVRWWVLRPERPLLDRLSHVHGDTSRL